jgi:hypothetical protein
VHTSAAQQPERHQHTAASHLNIPSIPARMPRLSGCGGRARQQASCTRIPDVSPARARPTIALPNGMLHLLLLTSGAIPLHVPFVLQVSSHARQVFIISKVGGFFSDLFHMIGIRSLHIILEANQHHHAIRLFQRASFQGPISSCKRKWIFHVAPFNSRNTIIVLLCHHL